MEIIKQDIKRAVEAIKEGKILICPTDTVYGLVCDVNNKKAVEKLYKIKKRPKSKPIPVFVKDIAMAGKLVEIDRNQKKFLSKVWPGPVTVVLKRRRGVKLYGAAKNTIAIRIPKYGLLLGVAEQLNKPLAQTSANVSGEPASGSIKKVLRQFGGQKYQPDLVIDAGNLKKSKPSKVIDLTVFPFKVLRI